MRKKMGKVLQILLATTMTFGLLTGCGTAKTESKPAEESKTEESVKTSESVQAESDAMDLSEKVTFSILVRQKATEGDYNDYPFVKIVEEKFNVDIEFEMIADDAWDEKWPLLYATGKLPDVVVRNIDCNVYGPQGYWVPLNEYISEELTPNICNMWEETPQTRINSISQDDGNIYYLLGADADPRQLDRNRTYINEVWANEILGKLPETTDELYEFLVAVKERDMDGDGDPNNEIPFGGNYNAKSNYANVLHPILAAFGHVEFGVEVLDDGTVIDARISDNYKEYLKYMNKLWEEGLMDPEFFTQDDAQRNSKDAEGLYGITANSTIVANHPDGSAYDRYCYSFFEPLTSPVNDVQMQRAVDFNNCGGFAISSEAENVERILMVMDWFFSEEGTYRIHSGIFEPGELEEAPNLTRRAISDGKGGIGFMTFDTDKTTEYTYETQVTDYYEDLGYASESEFWYKRNFTNYGSLPMYPTFHIDQYTAKYYVFESYEHHADYYTCRMPSGLVLSADESSEAGLLETDIKAYWQEMETKMIRGEIDIDTFWDEYVKGMKDRGVEERVKLYQDAYNRYAELLK